jgi:hypothetical protein
MWHAALQTAEARKAVYKNAWLKLETVLDTNLVREIFFNGV